MHAITVYVPITAGVVYLALVTEHGILKRIGEKDQEIRCVFLQLKNCVSCALVVSYLSFVFLFLGAVTAAAVVYASFRGGVGVGPYACARASVLFVCANAET